LTSCFSRISSPWMRSLFRSPKKPMGYAEV
jgi:hypothetical protein